MSWRDNILTKGAWKAYNKNKVMVEKKLTKHIEKINEQMFIKARTESSCHINWTTEERYKYLWDHGIQSAFEVFEDGKLIDHLEKVRELGLDKELDEIYPTIQQEISQSAKEKNLSEDAILRQYLNAGFVHTWKRMKKYYQKIRR